METELSGLIIGKNEYPLNANSKSLNPSKSSFAKLLLKFQNKFLNNGQI